MGFQNEVTEPMANLGYARVSTISQDLSLQLDALAKAGCEPVFEDRGVSGMAAARPGLDKMLEFARKGDIVTVWKLDRIGRSLANLVELVNLLSSRGVGFRSLTESIDTTTSSGRLIFHIFASLAQFERDLIVDRTRAGLEAAAAQGRKGGRPLTMTPEKLERALELLADNRLKKPEIARVLKVSRSVLYAAVAAHEAKLANP